MSWREFFFPASFRADPRPDETPPPPEAADRPPPARSATERPTGSDASLKQALAAVRGRVTFDGVRAGFTYEEVNDDAATFAAGICADDPGVAGEWADWFGLPETQFATMASRGRSWREHATRLLARGLALHGGRTTPQLESYSRSLSDLALATNWIGASTASRADAAEAARQAQNRAVNRIDIVSEAELARLSKERFTRNVEVLAAATVRSHAPVVIEPAPAPRGLDELMGELHALIGLDTVKDQVHQRAELLRIERLRHSKGLKAAEVSKHLVFTGNPGTGKTTIARLVAGIYRALGLLETGQLVETDRSGLVAGYVGQTALKTVDVVQSAVGGVLFIDEAYALANDDFGTEATDTLVKAMEDHRDDLVLIVAGYSEPMATFVASNPGLASRFPTTIHFPDYSDDELVAIFRELCRAADFVPTEPCVERFRASLRVVQRDHHFGNARYVRNQFEAAVVRQAWRLRDVADPTLDDLRTLTPEDLSGNDGAAPDAPP